VDGGRDWGGGQNQVRLLVKALDQRGIEQLCLCPAGSDLDLRLRADSLPVESIRWNAARDPRVMGRIYARADDYDLVHTHDADAMRAALLPARLRHRPLVATRRTLVRSRSPKWKRASSVIAVSDGVAHRLRASGVRPDRIRVIPSAIDIDEVVALPPATPTLRERLLLPDDAFLVGNVGALVSWKRQVMVARVAARLRDVYWVIIGEGPEWGAIQSAIVAHGVTQTVRMPGRLPDARRYLQELDAFLFPSVDEALGTSVLDAMARGVPVVAANSAGPAEVLRPVHDVTGVGLFPPDDPDTAAAHIRRIRDEPELRRRVVELQRQRMSAFRIGSLVDATLEVYRDVLGKR
jgi:glycosyltransferase involved in cell wall biosynthesis